MYNTIDYKLDDILNDNQQDDLLHNMNRQSITKVIHKLERTYFPDINIFRHDDKTSDYLFRFEIKDLLLLLIYIENKNPFDNKFDTEIGLSKKKFEKIEEITNVIKNKKMAKYERKLVDFAYRKNDFVNDSQGLQKLQEAICDYFTLVAINYRTFVPGYFGEMADLFNKLSLNITKHRNSFDYFKKEKNILKINMEGANMDLKLPLVHLIRDISELLYNFDEKGCCTRSYFLDKAFNYLKRKSKNSELYIQNLKENFPDLIEFDNDESYSSYINIDVDKKSDKDEAHIIQSRVQEFLNKYFECYIDGYFKKENDVKHFFLNKLHIQKCCQQYLKCWYIINAKLNDYSDPEIDIEMSELFKEQEKTDAILSFINKINFKTYEEFLTHADNWDNDSKKTFNSILCAHKCVESLEKGIDVTDSYKEIMDIIQKSEPNFERFVEEIKISQIKSIKYLTNKNIKNIYDSCKIVLGCYVSDFDNLENHLWLYINNNNLKLSQIKKDEEIWRIINSNISIITNEDMYLSKYFIDQEKELVKDNIIALSEQIEKILNNTISMELKLEDDRRKIRILDELNSIWSEV